MGASKKYYEDLMAVCIMPKDTYEELKDFNGLYKISEYDNNMRKYYKANEEWQEEHEAYNLAMDNKKRVEAQIDFNMLKNK